METAFLDQKHSFFGGDLKLKEIVEFVKGHFPPNTRDWFNRLR
jgi:hypothetical protein